MVIWNVNKTNGYFGMLIRQMVIWNVNKTNGYFGMLIRQMVILEC